MDLCDSKTVVVLVQFENCSSMDFKNCMDFENCIQSILVLEKGLLNEEVY